MNDKFTILIVEDDKYISNFISMSLKNAGYKLYIATSAAEALNLYYANNPDIMLLDLGLPDKDGMSVIKAVRKISEKPILVVSARQEESEKIAALDLGADDYITKPFHMGELMARIRVAERKANSLMSTDQADIFVCDYLVVDYEKRRVLVDDVEIHLTPMEYKLLLLLIANRGKVLTHNYILSKIWGYADSGDARSLRVFMATLRRKIEKETTNPRFILTEVGIGYRFTDK